MRRISIVAVGLVVISGALSAQGPAQPPATFRAEINYVQIPVRVLDARGAFVTGLTQSDFQISEDGQAQTIAAFSAINIPFVRHDAVIPETPWAVVEAVASNEPLQIDGRVYVFVLDNQSMAAAVALRTRHVMRRFISDGLGVNDVAAIVLTGTGRGQPFTRNRRLLSDAIDRLMSDADPSDNSTDRVMQRIADTAKWMGAIRGRRKALVLITPSSICSLVNTDLRVFSNCNEAAGHALRMAVQSDVSIYTIDPRGAVPTHGMPAEFSDSPGRFPAGIVRGPLDAARYIAEESGGFAVVNSNNLAEGFARVVRENSSYYLLGYYSTNTRADGQTRRNEIRVARTGLRTVYRGSYLAPLAKDDLPMAIAPATTSLDDQLQQLANNPLPVSAMPLRIAAAPFASAAGTSVSVVVEMPAATITRTGDASTQDSQIRLSIGFYDRSGRAVADEDPTIDVSPVPAEASRFVARMPVPPGVYRLWVGAVATPSRVSGSVMTDIEVPDFTRPKLLLSGISVSTGGPLLATRDFSSDDDLSLCGEIYDRRKRSGAFVGAVTVKSGGGQAVYQTPFALQGLQSRHCARIPLKRLGTGFYVATVEASSTSPSPASDFREVRFSVR